jgi:hypothetical protein
VRPREPAPMMPDPLILAQEALDDLENIKKAARG